MRKYQDTFWLIGSGQKCCEEWVPVMYNSLGQVGGVTNRVEDEVRIRRGRRREWIAVHKGAAGLV